MTAARRARQKARRQLPDPGEQLTLFDPPDTPDVTVQAGVASAAAVPAGEQDKD